MLKWTAALFSAAMVSACATTSPREEISAEAAARLAEFERTGEVETCLNIRSINQITALDERHFLVRVGVNQYYLNEIDGRCSGADRAGNRLQYSTSIGQLCRNEIIQVVDNLNGFTVGSCGLSAFEKLEKLPADDAE